MDEANTIRQQHHVWSVIPLFVNFYVAPRRPPKGISRISPVSGPAESAGTVVTFYGRGFVNTTSLACRFGLAPPVPARFVNSNELFCESPPLVIPAPEDQINEDEDNTGLMWSSLSEIRQQDSDPLTGYGQLFPGAHYYPLVMQRAVGVEVRPLPVGFRPSEHGRGLWYAPA